MLVPGTLFAAAIVMMLIIWYMCEQNRAEHFEITSIISGIFSPITFIGSLIFKGISKLFS
jgi:hypothetical protein